MMTFTSAWNNLLKHCISAKILLMEGYVQGALRKELRTELRFKTATSGKSYW